MTEQQHDVSPLPADAATSRALYLAREVLGRAVLVPLAVASLVTGVVQSLGTPWGLFRHWWVVVKLALTVLSTVVLLTCTGPLTALAVAARDPAGHTGVLPSASPVLHAGAALAVLLAAAALSVFRPRGLTRHGWRVQQAARRRLDA